MNIIKILFIVVKLRKTKFLLHTHFHLPGNLARVLNLIQSQKFVIILLLLLLSQTEKNLSLPYLLLSFMQPDFLSSNLRKWKLFDHVRVKVRHRLCDSVDTKTYWVTGSFQLLELFSKQLTCIWYSRPLFSL